MNKLLLRLLINAVALYVAARVVPGIQLGDNVAGRVGRGAGVRLGECRHPAVARLLTCPFIILTLGLFTLVINAVMLLLTSAFSRAVGLSFVVEGFWPAFWGALVVSIVSLVVTLVDSRRRLTLLSVRREGHEWVIMTLVSFMLF